MARKVQRRIGALGYDLPALRYHEDLSVQSPIRPAVLSLEPPVDGGARSNHEYFCATPNAPNWGQR
eukprot:11145817-Alexandrium_andersonii.AAC.1